ncbi:MAG: hypothetical protein Q4B58_02415 [Bacteroidales bacterium]|nr:hypothetical protein [Bacteroidales bacterium]
MLIKIPIAAKYRLSFSELADALGTNDIVLVVSPEEIPGTWAFFREKHSVTLFLLEETGDGYLLSMDRLASYDDYRFLPYLVDTLSLCLNKEHFTAEGKNAYQLMNEDWVADEMGEEIALLKCYLSLGLKYYLSLAKQMKHVYVDQEALKKMGVCIHSSTPRIFGYINYMLSHNLLPYDDVPEENDIDEDTEVDVPQHESIGTVLSWQIDGAETTESYCREDADILLEMAQNYEPEKPYEGVVLNDIATLTALA